MKGFAEWARARGRLGQPGRVGGAALEKQGHIFICVSQCASQNTASDLALLYYSL